jgi:hypothetical protein
MRALLFLALLLPSAAWAADPAIAQLQAVERKGKVSVAFHLTDALEEPEIAKAIQSGVPTGFTYDIELVRKRPNWFDKTLGQARIEVICTYNSVTHEYLINYRRNRKLVSSEVFGDFARAKEKMTRIAEPELFTTSKRANKLRVLAKAELIRSYMFYVIPRDVETEWRETRVKSAP